MRARHRLQGFTLLEVLLVIAIAGIALGAISLSVGRADDGQAALRAEGESIAQLFQLVRTEAILRNRETAFEADPVQYRFLVRESEGWQPIDRDGVLRERKFSLSPMRLSLDATPANKNALRIVFGREPIDTPFVLALGNDVARIAIRADGAGRFLVEQP